MRPNPRGELPYAADEVRIKEPLSNATLATVRGVEACFSRQNSRLDGGGRGLAAPSGVMRTQASCGPGTDWRALKARTPALRSWRCRDSALAGAELAFHDAEDVLDLRAHLAEPAIAGTLGLKFSSKTRVSCMWPPGSRSLPTRLMHAGITKNARPRRCAQHFMFALTMLGASP